MKFPVVAEHDPTCRANGREPYVISHVRRKMEFAIRVLMELDGKWRLGRPNYLRKALPTITIKKES